MVNFLLLITSNFTFYTAKSTLYGGGGGEDRELRLCHFSYIFGPLPLDSHPSLRCSHLQVNQEDQKPKFNFQSVLKLNIIVHFLAFVLVGDPWFLIADLSALSSMLRNS